MRIWCVHQGPQGEGSGSGEPSVLSGQLTLNDPEIGWPRLPEEEHSLLLVFFFFFYSAPPPNLVAMVTGPNFAYPQYI